MIDENFVAREFGRNEPLRTITTGILSGRFNIPQKGGKTDWKMMLHGFNFQIVIGCAVANRAGEIAAEVYFGNSKQKNKEFEKDEDVLILKIFSAADGSEEQMIYKRANFVNDYDLLKNLVNGRISRLVSPSVSIHVVD